MEGTDTVHTRTTNYGSEGSDNWALSMVGRFWRAGGERAKAMDRGGYFIGSCLAIVQYPLDRVEE